MLMNVRRENPADKKHMKNMSDPIQASLRGAAPLTAESRIKHV
jgi:hypothetical protein